MNVTSHETEHRMSISPVVVKVGGALLGEHVDRRTFWKQIAGLGPAVVVHGGGPQLTEMAKRLGHTPRMVQGRRVTGPHDLDIVRWVLRGELSTLLVTEALGCGVRAVGVSAVDADMVRVTRRPPWNVDGEVVDFGFVGDVERIQAGLLGDLLAAGYTPIVTPMGRDADGQIYNVNADTIAAAVAGAVGAEALLLVTEAAAVRDADGERLPELRTDDIDRGKAEGWITGGMRVKVDVALSALAGGTRSVWICGPDDIGGRLRATRIVPGAGVQAADRGGLA